MQSHLLGIKKMQSMYINWVGFINNIVLTFIHVKFKVLKNKDKSIVFKQCISISLGYTKWYIYSFFYNICCFKEFD